MNKSIVEAIKSKDYKHEWMTVEVQHGFDTLSLLMSFDSLKDEKGVRLSCSPVEMAECCELLGALPPTPHLLDYRFLQSCNKNEPQPKWYPGGKGMSTTDAVRGHSARVDKSLDDPKGSVGVPGKFWVAPLSLENLYGGHVLTSANIWKGIPMYLSVSGVAGLRVFQKRSGAHTGSDDSVIEPTHEDYMMGLVVVHRLGKLSNKFKLDGEIVDIKDLYDSGSPLVWGNEKLSGSFIVAAPLLSLRSEGPWVRTWQARLISLGVKLKADGDFGKITKQKTEWLQAAYGLPVTGVVNAELWKASEKPPVLPKLPAAPKPLTVEQKQKVFGRIEFKPHPVEGNPENIKITNGWQKNHIVLIDVPEMGMKALVHSTIAKQLQRFFKEAQAKNLLHHIKTVDGFWVPRLVRGRDYLSSHAWGTAFDINYRWNQLGAEPAEWFEEGSVKPFVELAQDCGFLWGGNFSRLDGNHFEAFEIQ